MTKFQKAMTFAFVGSLWIWIGIIVLHDIPELRKQNEDLINITAHQDQAIDYLMKQDSIHNPQNWKK